MTTNHLRLSAVAVAGVAAMTLAACGSSDDSASKASSAGTPSTSTSSSAAASSQQDTSGGKAMTVTMTEFHIAMGQHSLAPGTYTLRVKNAGQITHALTVDGPGVDNKSTGDMSAGASKTLTVTLKSGSYDVYCPVGNHKMEGMDETVKVG